MKAEKKPSRLSVPKAGLPRIYRIDEEIASGKYPNTKDLAKILFNDWGKVSISTIIRDIDFLRDRFHAPIEYDAYHRGYYYTEKTFRLPAGFTGEENMLALGMAKNILSLYRETPLYEASANLLDSIVAPLASDGNRDWLDKRIIVPKIASAKVEPDIWKTIVESLKENRIITFEYIGTWDNDYQQRKVYPYQLLFDSGVWYLYGFSEERKAIRLFSLSRMKNAVLTRSKFELPKNFDYTETTGDSFFGVFSGQEKLSFIIDCFADAVIYASERQWAADQKIEKNNEGVTLKFTSTQYQKVLQWVLSCGCNAFPKKPKKLVEDWKRHAQEMRKMQQK
ncbi:MAG: WYL domain-containing protein [Treponema sp.]|nr:WYL domain-containing protein [Treponema sp.]